MMLDDLMPQYCASLIRHTVVAAPPQITFDSIRRTDVFSDRKLRALFDLRTVPARVGARAKGVEPQESMPPSMTFAEVFDSPGGFHPLAEAPPHEILAGMIGRFWQKDLGVLDFKDAESFRDFNEPDYGKTVADFTVRPYGAARSLLSYESRTVCTTEEATRKFRRYFIALRPGIAYVMVSALRLIKAEAENAAKGA